jgi:hypothetical protein
MTATPASSSTPQAAAPTPGQTPASSGQPSKPAGDEPGAAGPSTGSTPGQPTAMAPAAPTELDHTQDIRGNCGINTGYPDDHACLVAPKPNEGFQIHVGPKNYDDPAEVAKFVMKPGEESSECFTFRTANTEQVVYQTWMLSGRAGTHHIISSAYSGEIPEGVFGNCGGIETADWTDPNAPAQIGSLPGASKSYMPRGLVAPEYAHVGQTIEANTLAQSDMHYFNFTDKDILREYWVNVYFAPPGTVTEYAKQLVGFGGMGWNATPIEPGTDMVYKYECPFVGNGYLMNLLGHYHAHGKRFTGSIKRTSGQIDKVFEMYDYLDPATFDYNSVTQNPAFGMNTAGAVSGQIAISDGDILQWECHIINDGDVALAYTNEVKTGEMCNIWGFTVGTEQFQCAMP